MHPPFKAQTKKKKEEKEEIIGCISLPLILLFYLLFTILKSNWLVL